MIRIATTLSTTARTLRNTGLRLLGHTGFPNKLAAEFAALNYWPLACQLSRARDPRHPLALT